MTPPSPPAQCGVLLVGHGTRDEVGTAEFFELARRLAQRVKPHPVAAGLLEFQSPTIPDAWDALVAQDVRHIHVAPLLLFAAGHAKEDIPSILESCSARSTEISLDQSRPLSRHPAIVRLARQRIAEALEDLSVETSSTSPRRIGLVMVGRGSHDPCAQADMRVLCEVVGRTIQTAGAVTAFYAMAEPRLPDVLEEVASSGDVDTIVVCPHLLFEGRLYRAVLEQTEQASKRFPHVQFRHTKYLGPDPLVAEAIADRIEQVPI